jgi:hypothetical protein
MWVEAGASVAAVVAAAIAAILLYKDIRQSAAQHREDLRAAHRPLIVVEAPKLVRGVDPQRPGDLALQITSRNVGPGLALDVEIRMWLRHVDGASATPETIDRLKATLDIDEPEFLIRVGALATADQRTRPVRPRRPIPEPRDRPVLFYLPLYRNVFKDAFPSVPREEWQVGSDLFPIGWSVEPFQV